MPSEEAPAAIENGYSRAGDELGELPQRLAARSFEADAGAPEASVALRSCPGDNAAERERIPESRQLHQQAKLVADLDRRRQLELGAAETDVEQAYVERKFIAGSVDAKRQAEFAAREQAKVPGS